MTIIQSGIITQDASIAIIVARFNNFINDHLLSGALDILIRIGRVHKENILTIHIPGTYEMSTIAEYIAKSKKHNAIITLGTIIQGNTDHFKYISQNTISNLSQISMKYCIPITLGILTTNNIEQSIERSGTKIGNKGSEAALAALEMINIMKELKTL